MAYTSTSERERHVDELLDDAVAESFPASDPVALAMPHRRDEVGTSHLQSPDLATLLLIGGGILAVVALLALRR
jgi:hypothetical protein